ANHSTVHFYRKDADGTEKHFAVDYSTGIARSEDYGGAEVLASVAEDAHYGSMSKEDFAGELGYDVYDQEDAERLDADRRAAVEHRRRAVAFCGEHESVEPYYDCPHDKAPRAAGRAGGASLFSALEQARRGEAALDLELREGVLRDRDLLEALDDLHHALVGHLPAVLVEVRIERLIEEELGTADLRDLLLRELRVAVHRRVGAALGGG